jgi:hypothetical protein
MAQKGLAASRKAEARAPRTYRLRFQHSSLPDFLGGAASVLSLAGLPEPALKDMAPWQLDAAALAEDWGACWADLQNCVILCLKEKGWGEPSQLEFDFGSPRERELKTDL